jgi:hypothetical protein
LEDSEILEKKVTIFSGSSGKYQSYKKKFGNPFAGIVY